MYRACKLAMMLCSCLGGFLSGAGVTGLSGRFSSGQVFLTWQERDLPVGATLRVYGHDRPILSETLSSASLLAEGIHLGSARDWWRDPSSFNPGKPAGKPCGFVLTPGGDELNPASGLHVHTVTAARAGRRYYAVTWESDGHEHRELVLGGNSLSAPLEVSVEQREVIWLGPKEKAPARGCAAGLPLVVSLHGRGGGAPRNSGRSALNCLYFGDSLQGWREGLPFKFQLRIEKNRVLITPSDRNWVGRPVLESPDRRDHCPAISTFWLGYNVNIRRSLKTDEIVFRPYVEAYLLGLLDWAQAYLGTDVNRTYFQGGSMGGSGSVSMALHYPHRIAAVNAQVPIYSYTWKRIAGGGGMSASRLLCFCGPLKGRVSRLWDGRDLFEYLDGARNLGQTCDLPPIFATNGRRDMSIPWVNNPPFYRAANKHKQAFAVYWNNGDHGMSRDAPQDVKAWSRLMMTYRLDLSFPVFTNCSDNRDYGDGHWSHGDLTGWINRGLDWKVLSDSPSEYGIRLRAHYEGLVYPVTVDVTIRRLQAFKVHAGEVLQVQVGGRQRQVTVGPDGLLTIPGVTLPSSSWCTVRVRRGQ